MDALVPVLTLVLGWTLSEFGAVRRERAARAAEARASREEHRRWLRERKAEAYAHYANVVVRFIAVLQYADRGDTASTGELVESLDRLVEQRGGRGYIDVVMFGSDDARALAAGIEEAWRPVTMSGFEADLPIVLQRLVPLSAQFSALVAREFAAEDGTDRT